MNLDRLYYNGDNPAFLGSFKKLAHAAAAARKSIITTTRKKRRNQRKNIKNWLNTQEAYTLHREARLNFPRNHYKVFGIDELWEADLIDLSKLKNKNDNYRYILSVIDVFSKYGFTYALKTKGAAEVTKAFKNIIDNSEKEGAGFKRQPMVLQSDRGKEFYNNILKRFLVSRGIGLQFPLTQSKHKAAVAERFNRTLQTYIYKYFTAQNTTRYIDILPKITRIYNNSVHRTIKMKPVNVNVKNVLEVYKNTHLNHQKNEKKNADNIYNQPFAVGDFVRVIRRKPIFEPGYTHKWSKEIFRISKIIEKNPYFFYKIEDSAKRPVREKFYKYELQLIRKI